jgi:hypothetical protein
METRLPLAARLPTTLLVDYVHCDGISQRNRGADVGLETALLERTTHTARSPCERRTRPRCVPGPPGPGLEVARGGRRLAGSAVRANPLPAPHSRAAKGGGAFNGNQSKAGGVAKAPSFKSKGCRTSAVACGASKTTRKKIRPPLPTSQPEMQRWAAGGGDAALS